MPWRAAWTEALIETDSGKLVLLVEPLRFLAMIEPFIAIRYETTQTPYVTFAIEIV